MKKEDKIYPYRLIFLDCSMPTMDGFEATRRIRNLYDDMKIEPQPYIVGLTTQKYQMNPTLQKNFDLKTNTSGMNEMIEKPLKADTLEGYLKKLKFIL